MWCSIRGSLYGLGDQMTLSKTDAKALNVMLQHAANGHTDTFERLIAAWVRSAPSALVLAKRQAALAEIGEPRLPDGAAA